MEIMTCNKKKLVNVDRGVDDDDAATLSQMDKLEISLRKDLTQLRTDSLQVDGSSYMTGDLDMRGQKIKLPGEINMNRKLIKNLDTDKSDDLSAVNMATLKKFSNGTPSSGNVIKNIDLKDKLNVKKLKTTKLCTAFGKL